MSTGSFGRGRDGSKSRAEDARNLEFGQGQLTLAARRVSPYDRLMPSHRVRADRRSREKPIGRGVDTAPPPILAQRPLKVDAASPLPVIRLRSVTHRSVVFRKMMDRADDWARPGDLVAVETPDGQRLGYGLFNPRAEIVARLLTRGDAMPDESFWQQRLEAAVRLRHEVLRLPDATDAYRVVHADSDGLPGLVVDRYGDVLSAEAHSLAMFQRSDAILERLAKLLGTKHTFVQVPAQSHGAEGFQTDPRSSPAAPDSVVVTEHGTKFRVHFEQGHKTGFFCDQRENRQRLTSFCAGKSVLDLCCYTGGFAIQAKRLGQAAEVTAVDLDETAIALARNNAKLNHQQIRFVHADAFAYMRDMLQNGRTFDVVVLDPPKLIRSRREFDEGKRTHFDLNRLAMQLVRPGGWLLTCSCSGLLSEPDFLKLLFAASRPRDAASREATPSSWQILARTGAGSDHPVALDVPETEYLKAVWMRKHS
jgi:23S rRNA (cytosine1962-C5)-methyltransferase